MNHPNHAYSRDQVYGKRSNLVYLDGKVFTALCRCGGSGNKPFCDGTHAKNGFHAKPADLKVLAEHSKVEA